MKGAISDKPGRSCTGVGVVKAKAGVISQNLRKTFKEEKFQALQKGRSAMHDGERV